MSLYTLSSHIQNEQNGTKNCKTCKNQFFYAQMNTCLASSTNNHIPSNTILDSAMISYLWLFDETKSQDSTASVEMRLQSA
jgi:hypothetical protein